MMSTIGFPETTCKQINMLLGDFWWGNKEDIRGFYIKACDNIFKPKLVMGLGLRRMEYINRTMIEKLNGPYRQR